MKLIPKARLVINPDTPVEQPTEQKETKKRKPNKLPPAEYKDLIEPKRFLVRESFPSDNPTKITKHYLEISVKRFDDDEAPVCAFIQMYQESERYTGYMKGKSIHLPIEMLYDLIENLQEVSDECDENGIE